MDQSGEFLKNYEDEVALEQAKKHVESNVIPCTSGTQCIDGRPGDHNQGKIATPGGDYGILMTLLPILEGKQIHLDQREVFDRLVRIINETGRPFSMHSDDHSTPDQTGCGHIAGGMGLQSADQYGLNPTKAHELFDFVMNKVLSNDPRIVVDILKGKHQERGVLVNTGRQNTVRSFDPQANSMYFLYDRERHFDEVGNIILPRLNLPISLDDYKRVHANQIDASMSKLASKRPIFEVNTDTTPTVQLLGKVK